jgi:hypothetical protein
VVAQQRPVPAQLSRVRIRPAEHLAEPRCEVLDVSRPALGTEDADQNRVGKAPAALRFGQTSKRISAPQVLEDRRFAHHALPRLS